MTKHSVLFALGATCLLSPSASAQKTEPPAKPEQQIRIERHIQDSDGSSHHITIVGDSVMLLEQPVIDDADLIDFDDTEADTEVSVDAEADVDIDIDLEADVNADAYIDMESLHDALNGQLRINTEAISARHDSIRTLVKERIHSAAKMRELSRMRRNAITERLNATRKINTEVKKLMSDLNGKMRELQRIRVIVDRDTVGLARELTSAQNALEAAREALEANRTTLEAARTRVDFDNNIMEANRKVMERNRSVAERNRKVIDAQREVINRNRKVMDAQRNVMNYNRGALATVRWPFGSPDSTTVAAINGYGLGDSQWNAYGKYNDSAYRQIWINQPKGRSAPNFRSFIDSTNGNHILVMPLEEFQSLEPLQPLAPLQPLQPLEPSQMVRPMNGALSIDGNGEVIVLESDSIRVVDGKDAQTIIRVVRDTTAHGHTSRITIITTSRSSGLDNQLCSSASAVTTDMAAATATTALNIPSAGYILGTNRPNPFSGTTTIAFTLPQPGHVTLTVFDAAGTVVRVLKDERLAAGSHTAVFDGGSLPSGTYLYRLVSGAFSETKTMTLEK